MTENKAKYRTEIQQVRRYIFLQLCFSVPCQVFVRCFPNRVTGPKNNYFILTMASYTTHKYLSYARKNFRGSSRLHFRFHHNHNHNSIPEIRIRASASRQLNLAFTLPMFKACPKWRAPRKMVLAIFFQITRKSFSALTKSYRWCSSLVKLSNHHQKHPCSWNS